MAQSSYNIQQNSFHIGFFAADKAHELQDRVSHLFHNDLAAQIELLFDRLIPAELILQIDQLVVNAGNIPFDRLDKDLVPAVIEALEIEIKASLVAYGITDTGASPKDQSIKRADYINAIEYYLTHGLLPWWITGLRLKDISDIVQHSLTDEAELLKTLLLRIGRHTSVQRRLARQFSWTLIKGLIALIEPQNAEFIFQYHDHVLQTQQKKNVIKAELHQIGTVMWELIFKILLSDAVGRFNRKMFLKSNIMGIANYFNISYSYLLEMLNIAPDMRKFRSTDLELVELLDELWKEETAAKLENRIYKDLNSSDTYTLLSTSDNLKIIYYYLLHGSIPASSSVKDEIMLNQLMLELINKVPDAVTRILRSLTDENDIGGKITAVFDEQVITKIIRLLEPASAEYIITYHANIQKLNQQQQLVKTEYADFSKTVWGLIINYLLADRGSDFNRQRFLESNIRSIASHYNLNLQQLVITLKQAALILLDDTQLTLFIAVLDTIIDAGQKHTQTEKTSDIEEHIDKPRYSKQQLKDVLLFWLKHGTMPWWYQYKNEPLQDIFNYFIKNTDGDTSEIIIDIILYAGTTTEMQQRLLNAVPLSYILKVFEKLPGGKRAVKVFNAWHVLLTTTTLVNLKQDKVLLAVTINLFWKSLADQSYRGFDLVAFLESNIGEFALWLGVEPAFVFKSLFDIVQSDTRFSDFREAFDTINSTNKLPGFIYDMAISHPMHDEWLKKVLSGYSGKTKMGAEATTQTLYTILEYFLTYNKLPPGIHISLPQKAELLRVIMLILFKKDPSLIKRLFLGRHDAAARIYMHNLFTLAPTGEAESVQIFLNDFIHDDLLLYLKDTANQSVGSLPEYVSQLLKQLMDKAISQHRYHSLQKLMQQQSVAALAARYFTSQQIYKLIESGNAGWGTDTVPFLQQIEVFFLSVSGIYEKEDLAYMLRQFNLTYFASGYTSVSPEAYVYRLLQYYKYYFQALTLTQLETLLQFNIHSVGLSASFLKIFPALKTFLQQQLERISNKPIPEKEQVSARREPAILPVNEREVAARLKKLAEESPELLTPKPELDEKESFYINNAGLVLLHPFLTVYFTRLDMLKDGKFISDEQQLRAVHLLQYLCDSTTNKPEPELLLNKILSGLSPQEPVPPEITLTDKEIQVSAELLKAVTQQWEKLNNTSVEGLQTSFLQRDGTLTYAEGNWHLRVESRSYDLLLQTLPWGLSLVKTSWMDTMLTIEWGQI